MPPESRGTARTRRTPIVEGGRRDLSRTARWAAEEQQSAGVIDTINGTEAPPRLPVGAVVSGRSPGRKPVNLVFYGYPAETIARVCGVSASTARSYKNGTRRPSKSVVTLMQAHRDGRFLGPEWKGFSVRGNRIESPEGGSVTAAQVRSYVICMQLLYEVTRGNPEQRALIDAAFAGMDAKRA